MEREKGIIERGTILEAKDGGYTVASLDRDGIITPPLMALEEHARRKMAEDGKEILEEGESAAVRFKGFLSSGCTDDPVSLLKRAGAPCRKQASR